MTDVDAGRGLFLHEVVDIVGQGAVPYMEHTVAFDAQAAADGGLRLLGTWQVVGSTGRWPQVVNIWELVDGWEGWRRLTERTNVRRAANVELSEWWDQAYRHRTGGFDRLLGAVTGSPGPTDLVSRGVAGSLFVHEISRVRPGTAGEYLAEVGDVYAPIAADLGHALVGMWEVLLSDTEVCTVWATDLDGHVAMMRARDDATSAAARWRTTARHFTTRWREELMVPLPGTPLAASAEGA